MNAVDMSQFIAAKSDQLNADDLMDSPKTITITRVTASPDAADQPVSIYYEGGEGRPFKPCKTCRRIMVAVWGKDTSHYIGRSMTLYRDPEVQFGGMKVGGIRISHMSHMDGDKTVALLVTRGRKAPFKVQALKGSPAQDEPPKMTPEEWVARYIDDVRGCSSVEELIAVQTRAAKGLTKLKDDRPDLHERASEAGTKRAAELQDADA